MKCLIIAAGKGERLSARGVPKPLVSLLGAPLIERVILTAGDAGVTDFYVVTGFNGEKVRRFLDKFSRERNINITHIQNEEWEKANGLSVLKAKKHLRENFILLMSDHIFNPDILQRIMNENVADGEVMLAVDYNTGPDSLVDIDDVTRVLAVDDRIIKIGKNIPDYNCYDTGIFHCSPAIFSAIEASIGEISDSSLSGGMRILAAEGKARTFDIGKNFWIDIDDEAALKQAENCLAERLNKPTGGSV